MGKRIRTPFSEVERDIIWKRWGEGALYPDIGRELARTATGVGYFVVRHGGIAPASRRRASRVLGLREREEISRGLVGGESLRSIARRLGRAASSISREIQRHGGALTYRAAAADSEAWDSARRPKKCRLATHPELRDLVSQKLRDDWSPEQISNWLVKTYPDDAHLHVSHETIYRTLYVQAEVL